MTIPAEEFFKIRKNYNIPTKKENEILQLKSKIRELEIKNNGLIQLIKILKNKKNMV